MELRPGGLRFIFFVFLQLNMLDGPSDGLASHGEPSAVSVLSPFLPQAISSTEEADPI